MAFPKVDSENSSFSQDNNLACFTATFSTRLHVSFLFGFLVMKPLWTEELKTGKLQVCWAVSKLSVTAKTTAALSDNIGTSFDFKVHLK